MHTLIIWQRSISQGFLHVIREKNWLMPISALSGILLLVQLLCISFICLQAFQVIVQEKTTIRLEIQPNSTNENIVDLITSINTLEYIEKIERLTPERSYQIMKEKDPSLIQFLEEFNFPNPFPETLEITIKNIHNYKDLTEYLQQEKWRTIVDPSFSATSNDQATYISQVISVVRAISTTLLIFIGISAMVLLYIIVELIRTRMYKRNEEIIIKRLCGAMHFYILLPFIIETVILLFGALCISYAGVAILLWVAPFIAPTIGSTGALTDVWITSQSILRSHLLVIIAIEIVSIIGISWFGTWIGSYKTMHTRNMGLERQ